MGKVCFWDSRVLNTDKFNLGIVKFDKNKTSKTHMHNVEVLYVISGKAKLK